MKNKEASSLRSACVPKARGEVLEIGIGSGLNFPFYSPEVRRVHGVNPSAELHRLARKRAAERRADVDFVLQSADEPLPFGDATRDSVLMTWTLCSIPNAPKALGEMRRVLKSAGRLIFIEHGRTPDSGVAAWQDRLTPPWRRIGGGCRLNRKIDDLIVAAGIHIEELGTYYLPGPRPMAYTYQGMARTNLE
jgi:ubiquinone/menaquinone biosynthesis C-methylase UbiE